MFFGFRSSSSIESRCVVFVCEWASSILVDMLTKTTWESRLTYCCYTFSLWDKQLPFSNRSCSMNNRMFLIRVTSFLLKTIVAINLDHSIGLRAFWLSMSAVCDAYRAHENHKREWIAICISQSLSTRQMSQLFRLFSEIHRSVFLMNQYTLRNESFT